MDPTEAAGDMFPIGMDGIFGIHESGTTTLRKRGQAKQRPENLNCGRIRVRQYSRMILLT